MKTRDPLKYTEQERMNKTVTVEGKRSTLTRLVLVGLTIAKEVRREAVLAGWWLALVSEFKQWTSSPLFLQQESSAQ